MRAIIQIILVGREDKAYQPRIYDEERKTSNWRLLILGEIKESLNFFKTVIKMDY